MKPVTAQGFADPWKSPIADIDVLQSGENQATSASVRFAIKLNQDVPDLIVSNIAPDTSTSIRHGRNFFGANRPQFEQYTAGNEAIIELSPDTGRLGKAARRSMSISRPV